MVIPAPVVLLFLAGSDGYSGSSGIAMYCWSDGNAESMLRLVGLDGSDGHAESSDHSGHATAGRCLFAAGSGIEIMQLTHPASRNPDCALVCKLEDLCESLCRSALKTSSYSSNL